jgi:phosphoribosylpyrophosphate synthetase
MNHEYQPQTDSVRDERFDFDATNLAHRDVSARFTEAEKSELSFIIEKAWKDLHKDELYRNAEILSFTSENYEWGKYPDGEAFALVNPHGRQLTDGKYASHLYASVNLEDSDDVLATQTILNHLHRPNTILCTSYFPYQRGDRTEIRENGNQELLLLNTLVMNIRNSCVKGLIHSNPHSPAFPWFCLKAGMAPLSLSTLPGLIREADSLGFLSGRDVVTANSDDGAKSSRQFLSKYICCDDSINGLKRKENGKTIVTYSEEDLRKVKDKIVVFTEDIISTGGTMISSILQLLNRGQAYRVVILATFPIFAGYALDRLGNDPRIQIITTDGRTPIADIRKSNNINVVPVKDKLPKILELDRQGIDFWSPTGKQKLEEQGLCLFPW